MTDTTGILDPIILGHNPFFGVDHLSRDRIPLRQAGSGHLAAVVEQIRLASECGAGGLMLPSGDRVTPLLNALRSEPALQEQLHIYPQIPHAGQLGARATERGTVGAVRDLLQEAGIRGTTSMATGGMKALISGDITQLLRTLLDMELNRFEGFHVPAVFLHPVFTDLALALGLEAPFRTYIDHLETRTAMRPAFCTLNLPLLFERFDEWSLDPPLVMSAVNAAGYRMNPSQASCEQTLRSADGPIVAMMILAGGHLPPDRAVDYALQFDSVGSVVIGASKPAHLKHSCRLLKERLADR